jgi:deazaflavin-dependent oxidoreductase (nitroreductase family)
VVPRVRPYFASEQAAGRRPYKMEILRKIFHVFNPFMILMWKLGMGRMINIWPAVIGRIMIIKHRGRKSGREYLTPVNYAIVDSEIYCTAGFGPTSDWYRNMLVNPNVKLRLPGGWHKAHAEDISDSPRRISLLRQVIIASGIAGPLFGVNQKKLNDEQLEAVSKEYRLIHFTLDK